MDLLIPKLAKVIHNLSQFALQTKEYVHFPAELLCALSGRI